VIGGRQNVVNKDVPSVQSNHASETECSAQGLLFPELTEKIVTVNFDGGCVSSDGGGVLVAQLDRSYGYVRRFASCFADYRNPDLIEHEVLALLRQRVYGLALGYEDLNDHDGLCRDPLLASLCGKTDPLGQDRVREQDQGKPLAGKSTLNRLELTPAGAGPAARYKKIVADAAALEAYFIREWVRSLAKDTREVILDLDRTNVPVHGEQEGRFFHGYYDEYCYTPLYVFCADWPIVAALHTAESEHRAEVLRVIEAAVAAVRRRFRHVRIILRGDSGFCRDELMQWCEAHGVKYVLGLARNGVLERILRGSLRTAKSMLDFNGSESERVYRDFRYRAQSWGPQKRRVVGKAEWTREGANPRFVITNLEAETWAAVDLYERLYCARGNMENRIKEQKLDLFATRASTEFLRANQLRLWFSTLAYLLMNQLRRVGLAGTKWATATCGTIRTRLLKIGAVLRVTVRRVWVSLSSAYPSAGLFAEVAQRLGGVPSG
jgi:hypothetical protein